MKITHCVFASTLLVTGNAWAELEILQTGIQLEPADKPPARSVGSVWRGLNDGEPYTNTLASETDSSNTYKDSNGCEWTEPKGFFRPPSTSWDDCGGQDGSARVAFKRGTIFPLQVGNKWSYGVMGGNWQTQRDCKVEDAVRIKTGVGEHDTFKVVCRDKFNTRTRYYSPKLQAVVHMERWGHRSGKRIRYEFIKYE